MRKEPSDTITLRTLQKGKPRVRKPDSFLIGLSLPAFAFEGGIFFFFFIIVEQDAQAMEHLCKDSPEQGQ